MPQAFSAPPGVPALEGRVVYDSQLDCVFVEYNGTRVFAMWPYGYRWAADQSAVQSPDGTHLARLGEPVRLVAVRGGIATLTNEATDVSTTALLRHSSCASGNVLLIMAIE